MEERDKMMEKWSSVISGMGMTGSKADWMSQYAQMHTDNETEMSDTVTEQAKFPSVLPMAMKIASQTVGLDLVSVLPMNNNTDEEITIIKAEVDAENRNRKIDSLIEGTEYEEMKITEHPDFELGPRGDLFYLDYTYGTQSNE
jgi:hypothetical protein